LRFKNIDDLKDVNDYDPESTLTFRNKTVDNYNEQRVKIEDT
jgi:hypothetical protein